MRLGVIDLGANSAHLLVVQVWEDGNFTPIFRDRAMIRLGAPVFDGGVIDARTQSNTAAAIGKFLQSCAHHDVDSIRTVATSAVREAENGPEFVDRIKRELGVDIEVISGREEARLTALAATESLGVRQGKILVMDVGGGTTEAAWIVNGYFEQLWSFQVGPVRLLNQVELADPPGPEGLKKLRKAIRKALGPLARAQLPKPDMTLATSGTALVLGELCGTRGRAATSLETHVVVRPALKNLLERLSEMTLEKRREWLGPHSDRADTIVGGGMVFLTALQELEIDTLITGGKALREGIIMDYIQREVLSTAEDRSRRLAEHAKQASLPSDPNAVRERNILQLARMYRYDPIHCHKVLEHANALFDGLYNLHWLGAEDRFYLNSGALLHDIGYHIGPTNHHRHSQYLILHSEIEGFHRMEMKIVSTLVRYHSRESPDLGHREYGSMPDSVRRKVDVLAGILRVADALDFTHRGIVTISNVRIEEDAIVLELAGSLPMDLEVQEAYFKGDLLEKAFGRQLRIEADEPEEEAVETEGSEERDAAGTTLARD
jgi:exopolyphosphatase/guanosine-5'-triphosphate,3'-diphosphate pyrophosphatase